MEYRKLMRNCWKKVYLRIKSILKQCVLGELKNYDDHGDKVNNMYMPKAEGSLRESVR